MVIVGLGGLKGVGKDTIADYLVSQYGFQKASLADPIKKLLNERFGWDPELWNERWWKEGSAVQFGGHPSEIPGIKFEYFSPRSWAQWLGTEVGRTIGGQDVWVDLLFTELRKAPPESRFVISDCRFQNEVHAVHDYSGFSICLVDPDRNETPEHVSEAVNPEWYDHVVGAERGRIQRTKDLVDLVMAMEGVSPVGTH